MATINNSNDFVRLMEAGLESRVKTHLVNSLYEKYEKEINEAATKAKAEVRKEILGTVEGVVIGKIHHMRDMARMLDQLDIVVHVGDKDGKEK